MLAPDGLRRILRTAFMLIAGCAAGVPERTVEASPPPATVGILVANWISSPVPAAMELSVNGRIVASGVVGARKLLWQGHVPYGAKVRLKVKWNGVTQAKALRVTRHGTYLGPSLWTTNRYRIEFTKQLRSSVAP